jgi:hypothetical protein
MSITALSPLLASCVPPTLWGAIVNRERNHRTLTSMPPPGQSGKKQAEHGDG